MPGDSSSGLYNCFPLQVRKSLVAVAYHTEVSYCSESKLNMKVSLDLFYFVKSLSGSDPENQTLGPP